jgi:DNA-binding CsgD family transcriptional regulator
MARKSVATPSWSETMRQHYRRAEFLAAADVYDEAVGDGATPSYDDELRRARVALKHDVNVAVASLIRRAPKSANGARRGEWALLLGIGYARMRDFERADRHFEMAGGILTTTADRAQLAYHRSVRQLFEGRTDEAWRLAGEMSCDRSLTTRISNEMLNSFILSREERYREEAESLIRAIGLIGKQRDAHREQWFHAVQNLALLGRELAFDEAATLARREVDEDVEWPVDFLTQHFQALKAVGWTCALRGDLLGCFRYLRAAERSKPSMAYEAILLLDRAYFARIIGEPNWSRDEVAKADAIAEGIDWNELPGEERIGLLLMAEAMAESNPEKAHFYLARYKGLGRIRSPLHLFAFDRRCDAFAAYAEGVAKLKGGEPGAEEALRTAWTIFDRIGYDWRASRTALSLLEATKKERWRHLAEDKLESYPQSWLAREISQHDVATTEAVALPRMQRKVLDMLCQKMTTAEIATDLGLSPHTIRNHLKAVFRAYDVHNRASLVAEVARRGELPAPARSPSH